MSLSPINIAKSSLVQLPQKLQIRLGGGNKTSSDVPTVAEEEKEKKSHLTWQLKTLTFKITTYTSEAGLCL